MYENRKPQKITYSSELKFYEACPYKVPIAYVTRPRDELKRLESRK